MVAGTLDGDHKIYLQTKAIQPVKTKQTADPEFPSPKRKHQHEGHVVLHFIVDEQGAVRYPAIDESSGPEFSKPSLDAVQAWTFDPAKLHGKPVATLISINIDFRLYARP